MQVSHYTHFRHEVIELASWLDFTWGNAVKYICRAPFKGDYAGDVRKAIDYIQYAQSPDVPQVSKKPNAPLPEGLFEDFIEDLFNAGHYYLSHALFWVMRGKPDLAVATLEGLLEIKGESKCHEN